MPRFGGDGGGGGESASGESQSNSNAQTSAGWLGGATRTVTGSATGANYVVLGGTRYGLRLSQDSLPPASSREESLERVRKRNSHESESRERLTDAKPGFDLVASDCCCIGPRVRLLPLGSRIPLSWTNSSSGSGGARQHHLASSASSTPQQQQQPPNSTSNNSGRCWPQSEQLVGGGSRRNNGNPNSSSPASSSYSTSSSSSSSSSSASLPAEQPNAASAVVPSVPRQLAQWTKHQSLRLQEPAVTAVDRLQRFRWSGGGGGASGKKSSSRSSDKAERLRELTEKLKGPAPVPPPRRPSRLHASSPPPQISQDDVNQSTAASNQASPFSQQPLNRRDDGRVSCRSFTFSEGSSNHPNVPTLASGSSSPAPSSPRNHNSRQLNRSESVGEEYYGDPLSADNKEPINSNDDNDASVSAGVGAGARHSRQYSDSILHQDNAIDSYVESANQAAVCCENEARDALAGLMEPRPPSSTGLYPGQRQGQPFRSASFGQADCNYGSTSSSGGRPSSSLANSRRAAFAAASAVEKEVRASTLPRVRRLDDSSSPTPSIATTTIDDTLAAAPVEEGASAVAAPAPPSPRASSPSLTDSAVGSSAEGLIGQGSNPASEVLGDEAFRPRSDGSDSLVTSSAIASPEPSEKRNSEAANEDQAPGHSENAEGAAEAAAVKESVIKECRIEPHEVIITPPLEELLEQQPTANLQQQQQQQQQQQSNCLRLSAASEASEAPSEASYASEASTIAAAAAAAATPAGKLRRYRGDTSKRRKGVYITQWPEPASDELRSKLSGQSSEERDEPPPSATPSDLSDCEGQAGPRRYSKRPLRGPYGQMLEAEMAKQPRQATDLVGLVADDGLRQRRKVSANLSFNASSSSGASAEAAGPPTPCHHRTTSSPSKLEGLPGPSPELLAELLRGSSERVARAPVHRNDTRTHVVVELYDTERSYVEALQILVNKYLHTLKSPENAHLVDAAIVDEIFYQVPAILSHHEVFLEELRKRLETWELRQTIGDVFLEVFTKPVVLETYTLFLDNWKSAKKAIKTTCQAKPAFARFLETMEREHKGKLGLDQLLIKPVQKIPRYELLIQRLLKHTDTSHPDYQLLTAALKEVHELVVKINCTERESLEWEQQQTTLKEVQSLVEGLAGIVTNDRAFIRHDLVSIASNQGTRKERGLFLFSDLLVITSIKRRSGTIRKPSTSSCPNSLVGLLEANKYKMLMRIPLDDLEVMKAKDENLRRMAREVDHLREDCATLGQLQELAATLHGAKQQLEDLIKEMLGQTQKQLAERNAAHSQLACLELTLNTQAGMENISVMFAKPDKRASWEESFNEAKQKLAASTDRRPVPEFVGPLPVRKTRAGLQFTCAAPTLANGQGARDVWVCNSDGYVGQVCVLSLSPEPPQVTSCNGVCNARILCVAGIPACTTVSNSCAPINFVNNKSGVGVSIQNTDTSSGNIQLDSSSSDDSDSDDIPCADTASASIGGDASSLEGGIVDEDSNQPTMWLGTEDGCVHVFNCSDNIRIKKNKVKILHSSSVHCIIYLDNKVFLSLANGDITVYSRDHLGGWNTAEPTSLSVGTVASPVTKMLPVSGKLWCGSHNSVKILNTYSLEIEHTFTVSADSNRPISCMASSGGLGVWISLHNSAVLKLFHAGTYECLADVNIAPAVTNMLANCDDIIRQHKAACLRVTALLACNELLWIGTSAGVLLTVPIPHIKPSTLRMSQAPVVTGIPHGHTGHVRFLTCVEIASPPKSEPRPKVNRYSLKGSKSLMGQHSSSLSSSGSTTSSGSGGAERGRLLVISGGDGYEDFRGPQASAELQAGRDDSTNHLLLWKV
ncbi:uncharacterized protein LOC100123336 isoform X2 [Nasonia vitripennis]|uniref:DH domain-containing protein n=1 Tax=Nasonia vitripennis TaxID=7425 RepID=A0A7M7TCQ4_NASVI|nr:uncharacterized protein LOC100123336 isoform X2 [Nasonia vitripennis]